MIPHYILKVEKLILSDKTTEWCRLEYPDHRNGCPMYGNKEGCPPNVISFSSYFDLSKDLYFVFSEFNVDSWANRMRKIHPTWTERQCRNLLYWQPKSRKQLKERVKVAMVIFGMDRVVYTPEAMGVNVYATCLYSGLRLEKIKNLKWCHHVAFVGYRNGTFCL